MLFRSGPGGSFLEGFLKSERMEKRVIKKTTMAATSSLRRNVSKAMVCVCVCVYSEGLCNNATMSIRIGLCDIRWCLDALHI